MISQIKNASLRKHLQKVTNENEVWYLLDLSFGGYEHISACYGAISDLMTNDTQCELCMYRVTGPLKYLWILTQGDFHTVMLSITW